MTPAQRRTLESAMERILPSGDGPGAREANAIGCMDWLVRQPVYARVEQRLLFGLGLLDSLATSLHGRPFADCAPEQQDAVLRRVQQIPHRTAQRFFSQLVWLTLAGFLCPPEYGGNRGRAGWSFIGFEPHPVTAAAPGAGA